MKNFLVMTATVVLVPIAAPTSATELPSYELAGFPISPHQFSVLGSPYIKEQSPSPLLTMGGMPASPHQVAVLTPRPKTNEDVAATSPIESVSFSSR